ncbi:hypothetical protein TNCV_4464961 [Trichonephila clavipes]|nr:hypothetical protein TNCV_4464961 [Trichonephila clavipes]
MAGKIMDLNPIEHVWDFFRRLEARTLPPVTIRELRLALQDEWAAIPQQPIIQSPSFSVASRPPGRSYTLKTGCIADSMTGIAFSPFSRIDTPCYFSINIFIPMIPLIIYSIYTHMSLYWDITVFYVDLEKAFVQSIY